MTVHVHLRVRACVRERDELTRVLQSVSSLAV